MKTKRMMAKVDKMLEDLGKMIKKLNNNYEFDMADNAKCAKAELEGLRFKLDE